MGECRGRLPPLYCAITLLMLVAMGNRCRGELVFLPPSLHLCCWSHTPTIKMAIFFLFRMSVDGNKEPLVEEGWECNNRGMENEWWGGWMKRSRTPSFSGPRLCISPFIIVRGAIYGHGRGDRAMPVRTGDFERTQRHERNPKYIFKSKSVHSAAILVIHLCTHMLFQIIIIIIDIAIINK